MKNQDSPPRADSSEVNAAPEAVESAARPALDGLLPAAYDDLRALARRWLSRERPDHLLQTTALVHEAYLRLLADRAAGRGGPDHCLALASMTMRRILVDEARAAQRAKRGGEWSRVPLHAVDAAAEDSVDLSALDEALTLLAVHDERKCRVVEMRFFGGLSNARIAAALGLTERTIERDWQYARAWLFRALSDARDAAPREPRHAD